MDIHYHTPPLHRWERWCRRVRPQQKPWPRRVPSSLTWSCWQTLAVDAWIPVIALWEGQRRDSGGSGRGWEKKRANRVLTHRGDRQRCSWQACIALTSSQAGTSWRLSIKMDNHHSEEPTEEPLFGEHKAKYQFQGEPRIIADTLLSDLSVSSLQTLKLNSYLVLCQAWSSLQGQFTNITHTQKKIWLCCMKLQEWEWLFSLLI